MAQARWALKRGTAREHREDVVEAAGVEPASEGVTGQETTCLFAFMPQALGVSTLPRTFAAHAQNGQETRAASL
jgi:hypothetical protein